MMLCSNRTRGISPPPPVRFCLFVLGALALEIPLCFAQIPGTQQTRSGYDTDAGVDAICWKSQSAINEEGFEFPNPLVSGFIVDIEGVQLLAACPIGNNVSGTQPDEHVIDGEQLRTGQDYNYTVSLDINMTSLGATSGFISDQGPGFIAIQVLSCVAGLGFCSPFVHEQANFREADAEAVALAANPNYIPKSTKRLRGDLHGGSHIHSGYTPASLPLEQGPIFKDLQFKIPQLIRVPGDYYTIVAVQLYFWVDRGDSGGEPMLVRYDMANKLDELQSLTSYAEPAVILEVDDGVIYVSYVIIAVSGLMMLAMLLALLKNFSHQVTKLGQGPFLSLFLLTGMVATTASFLLQPKNDAYCRWSKPIIMISLHTFYAVTLGRLWRIHALISPLLLKSLDVQTTCTRLKPYLDRIDCGRNHGNLHKQVTGRQLSIFISVLVAPQVLLQLLSAFLQPRHRDIVLNDDESKGRAVCETESELALAANLSNWGYGLFMILVAALLAIAFESRNLPSLFNESKTIFDSAFTTVIILIMGVAVILVTDDPETSPSVSYLVLIIVVLSITLNTSVRIVMPKLRMIWRNETVVVSQLVLDHAKEMRKSIASRCSSVGARPATGIIYDDESFVNSMKMVHRSEEFGSGIIPNRSTSSIADGTSDFLQPEPEVKEEISQSIACEDNSTNVENSMIGEHLPNQRKIGFLGLAGEKYEAKDNSKGKENKKHEFVVSSDDAPPRRLFLKMVDLHEHLGRMTRRVMSGMAVTEEDWEQARSLTGRVGNMFQNDVMFEWEGIIKEDIAAEDEDSSN